MRIWMALVTTLVVHPALAGATPSSNSGVSAPEPNQVLADRFEEPSRTEWLRRIDEAKSRAQLLRALAIAGQGQSLSTQKISTDKVTIERFLNDDLAYGDIVVTSSGPMVFVGRRGEPAAPAHFVPVAHRDSPVRELAHVLKQAFVR